MLSLNYENINNVMTQILKLSCASFSHVNISYVLALHPVCLIDTKEYMKLHYDFQAFTNSWNTSNSSDVFTNVEFWIYDFLMNIYYDFCFIWQTVSTAYIEKNPWTQSWNKLVKTSDEVVDISWAYLFDKNDIKTIPAP